MLGDDVSLLLEDEHLPAGSPVFPCSASFLIKEEISFPTFSALRVRAKICCCRFIDRFSWSSYLTQQPYQHCECEPRYGRRRRTAWQWGGCSDNVYFGDQVVLIGNMVTISLIITITFIIIRLFQWRHTLTNRDIITKLQVSRQFLDSRELGNSPKSLANLHNNQVTVTVVVVLIIWFRNATIIMHFLTCL